MAFHRLRYIPSQSVPQLSPCVMNALKMTLVPKWNIYNAFRWIKGEATVQLQSEMVSELPNNSPNHDSEKPQLQNTPVCSPFLLDQPKTCGGQEGYSDWFCLRHAGLDKTRSFVMMAPQLSQLNTPYWGCCIKQGRKVNIRPGHQPSCCQVQWTINQVGIAGYNFVTEKMTQ